jgi:hypothetical protein
MTLEALRRGDTPHNVAAILQKPRYFPARVPGPQVPDRLRARTSSPHNPNSLTGDVDPFLEFSFQLFFRCNAACHPMHYRRFIGVPSWWPAGPQCRVEPGADRLHSPAAPERKTAPATHVPATLAFARMACPRWLASVLDRKAPHPSWFRQSKRRTGAL